MPPSSGQQHEGRRWATRSARSGRLGRIDPRSREVIPSILARDALTAGCHADRPYRVQMAPAVGLPWNAMSPRRFDEFYKDDPPACCC